MKRALYLVCIAAILVAMLLGRPTTHAAAPDSQPASAEVKVDNFAFTPATLTVSVGTQVTWTNRDDVPHTVFSEDKILKSKPLDTDEKFAFTFTQPGTYSYFCSIHPKMKGTVVVK